MTEDEAKLILTIDLRAGHIVLNVCNESSEVHGKARFQPAQCVEAMRWLHQFDGVDYRHVQLSPSCANPNEHELGEDFEVAPWIDYVVSSMRSSSYDPREPMPEDQPTTKNGEVMCVGCKTRYTTSRCGFDNRKSHCPECGGWTAVWLKDA